MCDSWFPRSLYFVFWGLMPQVLRIWNLYTAFYCWALQWQFQVFHMRNTHFWSLFCIVCIVCNKFKPKWRLSNTSVMVQIDYFKVKYKNGKNTFKNIKIMMHYLSLYFASHWHCFSGLQRWFLDTLMGKQLSHFHCACLPN